MTTVLAEMNQFLKPAQPLEPTLGDEFQGGFATVQDKDKDCGPQQLEAEMLRERVDS